MEPEKQEVWKKPSCHRYYPSECFRAGSNEGEAVINFPLRGVSLKKFQQRIAHLGLQGRSQTHALPGAAKTTGPSPDPRQGL